MKATFMNQTHQLKYLSLKGRHIGEQGVYKFWSASGIIALCGLGTTSQVQAQIAADGTLATKVQTTDNRNFTITDGNRAGSNLFHSFSEFSVPTGGTAFFNNGLEIQNIITRVTGSSISNIDGLIRANGAANLFLLNPNGIIFGPHASLAIGGSILASTARSLNFVDGTQFSATAHPTRPLLTISVPIGLQFETAGEVRVQGSELAVQPGKTLALVGGDITLEGGEVASSGGTNLAASGGRIELGSVAGTGLVSLTPIEKGWSLGYEGIQNFKNIQLSQQAFVDASDNVQMSQPIANASDKGGGDVQLQGRHVTLTDGSGIVTGSGGAKPGGTLSVKVTDSVELSGTAPNNSDFFSSLSTQTTGVGASGDLTINTGKLIVQDGAQVSASTLGAGQGGTLVVNASDSVVLSRTAPNGNSSGLFTQTEGSGNAGNLTINTGKLIVQDGAQVSASTSGTGQGGTLVVNASTSVQLSETGTAADGRLFASGVFAQTFQNLDTGAAGNLTINTGKLIVQDGAQLAVSTRSEGQGGNLKVTASDSVELSGTAAKNELTSGLFARTLSTGAAGNLTIATRRLIVRDGAQVTVGSVGSGSGSAGNLEISARSISLDNQGKLTAETGSAQGGNIKLYDLDLLLMRHGSQISATAGTANAYGDGGNININTNFLVAVPSEDSDITANAYTGKGGSIQIAASAIFGINPQNRDTLQSDITASSQLGINGTVQINMLDINPLGLVALPLELVDVTGLIAQSCPGSGGNVGRGESKFIITGRGGLPPNPSVPLNSDALWIDLDSTTQLAENRSSLKEVTQVTNSTTEPLVEATGWVTNDKGQVVLIASARTATPHSLGLTPAMCHVP